MLLSFLSARHNAAPYPYGIFVITGSLCVFRFQLSSVSPKPPVVDDDGSGWLGCTMLLAKVNASVKK